MQEKSKKEILEIGKVFSDRNLDDENLSILLDALNSSNSCRRAAAAFSLGRTNDIRAIGPLLNKLKENLSDEEAAYSILMGLNHFSSVEYLSDEIKKMIFNELEVADALLVHLQYLHNGRDIIKSEQDNIIKKLDYIKETMEIILEDDKQKRETRYLNGLRDINLEL